MLGNFWCTLLGKLNTHLCSNLKKKKPNINNALDRVLPLSGSTRSLHHELIPYIHLHWHQSQERWHEMCQPSNGSIPQCQLCCPEVAPERWYSRIATRQCCHYFLSHQQGKLHCLTGSHSPSVIPASSQFNLFCN